MRKILFIFLIISINAHLFSREKGELTKINLPEYSFINYAINQIQLPGDSSRMKFFYQKVDKLLKEGEEQLHILHIGGSHIQADVLSNRVRWNLETINSSYRTPRGFIFPFSVAKTNNPTNYKVSYTGEWQNVRNIQNDREISIGVGGIAVYTSDPDAAISVLLNPDESSKRWDFNRLRLLGYTEDEPGTVQPILYYQDSIIQPHFDRFDNCYLFDLPDPADSFHVGFIQRDTVPHTFILTGFIPEKETPGIVYHSIGVNGATVSSYLNCEFFEDELAFIRPDVVIFEIGINDASGKNFTVNSFINNYNLLINRIKALYPDCAFIFITNNDSFRRITKRRYRVNTNGALVQDAFFKIAEKNQGGVWDLFSIMGGLNSMQIWQKNGLAQSDKVHFTRSGYELLGDLFYNALIDFYLQNDIE